MRTTSFLVAIAGTASAAINTGQWQAPSNGDLRGPCPALNSLANHGFIPRDGKNLTVELLVKALGEHLNVSTEVAATVAKAGMRTSSDPSSCTYTLADIRKHNAIEHDASLSRKDFSVDGDNFSFDQDIFDEYMAHFNGSEEITIPAAAAARWGRVQSEKARNPQFMYSDTGRFNSYVESSILLELFRDPKTMTSSAKLIRIFFEQERLPYEEGWRPNNRLDPFTLAQDILALALNTPEKAPGLGVAESTYEAGFFRPRLG